MAAQVDYFDDPHVDNLIRRSLDNNRPTEELKDSLAKYFRSRFPCDVVFGKVKKVPNYRVGEYLYIHTHDFRLVFDHGELISLEIDLDQVFDYKPAFTELLINEEINKYSYKIGDYYETIDVSDMFDEEEGDNNPIYVDVLIEKGKINMKSPNRQ